MEQDNISRNFTSIEQSKKLLDLGINPSTADCEWASDWCSFEIQEPNIGKIIDRQPPYLKIGCSCSGVILSWSLSALMQTMPNLPRVEYNLVYREDECYLAFDDLNKNIHKDFLGDTLIRATYNALVWLLNNGYIKKWAPFTIEDVEELNLDNL